MSLSRRIGFCLAWFGCAANCGPSNPEAHDKGQTGSIGEEPTSESCADQANGRVSELRSPAPAPAAFLSSRCGRASVSGYDGPSCECATSEDSFLLVGPRGDYCSVTDRGYGCLWDARDFAVCDLADSSSCQAICAELQRRRTKDALRTYDAKVRLARVDSAGSACEIIIEVDGQCYPSLSGPGYDCSLGDTEILERESVRKTQARAPSHVDSPEVGTTQTLPSSPDLVGAPASVGRDRTDANSSSNVEAPETGASPTERKRIYAPRDPNEWQGMLVDISVRLACESSACCGLALACVDGYCAPCIDDAQCAAGEGCVLDHCMPASSIECRTYEDCNAGALCVLSGITGGTARGNEDMRAFCLSSGGGASKQR